jgi:glutathione S-transferase
VDVLSGEKWRVFATLTFDERVSKRFMGQPEDQSRVQMAANKLRAAATVLDAPFVTHSHIVGDRLTLADFHIAGPFSQNERTKNPLNEFPNLVAWQQCLLDTVPAWAATKREVDDRIDSALQGAGITL